MSGGKKARGKHRLDKYYHLAKEQGYRSRAAFKLVQLNRKHGFLDKARAVLDLCAAPGGWLQVCSKHLPLAARVIGVDLVPIRPIKGVSTFVGDITTQKCRVQLRKESGGSMFDVVLHDGAPNVGGAFASEMYTQSALVLDACKLATEFLTPGGAFVTKVFRSRDYTALLFAFNQLFTRVVATKPQASRNTSAEIFVVCMGFKAPGKIDPRLLDHRSLFQDVEAPQLPMGPDALLKRIGKKQRHRSGYEAGTSLMHQELSAVEFMRAKDPMPLLAQYSTIVLHGPASASARSEVCGSTEQNGKASLGPDDTAALIRTHPATTDEVLSLCKDLQVLGRSEFKALVRWRLKVRKDLCKTDKLQQGGSVVGQEEEGTSGDDAQIQAVAVDEGGSDTDGDGDEKLLGEMEALREKMERDVKKDRRKKREVKRKMKLRLASAAQVDGIGEELHQGEDKLFSLTTIKGLKALKETGEAAALDEEQLAKTLDAVDSDEELVSSAEGEDAGSDEEALRYEGMVEDYLEASYQKYLERRGAREALRVEKRKRKRLDGADDEDLATTREADSDGGADADSDDDLDTADATAGRADVARTPRLREEGDDDDNDDDDDEAGGGLLVSLDPAQVGVRSNADAITEQWFSQDIFKDLDMMESDEEEPSPQRRKRSSQRSDASHAAPELASKQGTQHEETGTRSSHGGKLDSKSDGPVPESVKQMRPKHGSGVQPGSKGAGLDVRAPSDVSSEDGDLLNSAPAQSGSGLDGKQTGEPDELVVVPKDAFDGDSTDTEAEFEAMDLHAQAEIRAMARKWMRSTKNKLGLLDAAYNRYTFNDEGLPRWFKDDERRHMQPQAPVTRAEIEAEKELLRAIDTRPLKKVAEAKARKRRKVQQKLTQARGKAEAIVDNEDMSAQAKAREVKKLYSNAQKAGRDKKSAVKSDKKLSRSAREKARRKGPPLDRRMIADKMKGRAKAITQGKKKGKRQRK